MLIEILTAFLGLWNKIQLVKLRSIPESEGNE